MTSMTSSSIRKIVLAKPTDGNVGLSFVRSRAENSDVGNLINPDSEIKPTGLDRLIKPSFDVLTSAFQINKDAYELYKIQAHVYKTLLAEYEREKKTLAKINSFIQKTLAMQNVSYIQKIDPHPGNILRALKQQLASTNTTRSLEIEERYHQLCKGPEE